MIKERGSAIITAIFVTVLIATVATAIAWFSHDLVKAAIARKNASRIQYLLNASIPTVETAIDESSHFTHTLDFETKQDGITVRSYVHSPQWMLNINLFANLNPKLQTQAIRNLSAFIKLIGVKKNPIQVAGILISTVNHPITATGDKINLYQWPGQPLVLPSALRAIPGLSTKTIDILRNWITVLPTTARLIPSDLYWPTLVAAGVPSESAEKIALCLKRQSTQPAATAASNCKLPSTVNQGLLTNTENLHYFNVYSYFTEKKREYQQETLLYQNKQQSGVSQWYIIWQHSKID